MPKRRLPSDKRHITHFHRGDWKKDPGVTLLNSFERGVWVGVIFLLDECSPRGYAMHPNGKPMSLSDIAWAVKAPMDSFEDVRNAIEKLINVGVASLDNFTGSKTAGALFCRRIVRDEAVRSAASKNGSKGGNPVLLKQKKSKNLSDSKQSEKEPEVKGTDKLRFTGLPVESKEEIPSVSLSEAAPLTRLFDAIDFWNSEVAPAFGKRTVSKKYLDGIKKKYEELEDFMARRHPEWTLKAALQKALTLPNALGSSSWFTFREFLFEHNYKQKNVRLWTGYYDSLEKKHESHQERKDRKFEDRVGKILGDAGPRPMVSSGEDRRALPPAPES